MYHYTVDLMDALTMKTETIAKYDDSMAAVCKIIEIVNSEPGWLRYGKHSWSNPQRSKVLMVAARWTGSTKPTYGGFKKRIT